ncbi:alkaline phosphodiesterase [Turkeypox virus]|uniref:Alkaline phosphodiesterase n=1 Tax=Turkeypox virus TaxID=336486 RepID=A0A0M3PB47_9POXV|nr:alkaline phosphodiesterase [Turkeypox virus]ALA62386.1 alkaline phosphodiesterase [Turkeypox virus]
MKYEYNSDSSDISVDSDHGYQLYAIEEEMSEDCISSRSSNTNKVNILYTIDTSRRYISKIQCIYCLGSILLVSIVFGIIFGISSRNNIIISQGKCEDDTYYCPDGFTRSPLILIAMDGFRFSYLDKWRDSIPTISKLLKCGVVAPLRPVYPTKTFPNLYTIVTGLYPESHGIIDNKMYDPIMDSYFATNTDQKFNPAWYKGVPIWLNAINNGIKAATYFWPGSDAPIQGKYPSIYKKYNQTVPFTTRIDTILEWLNMKDDSKPYFQTLYFHEPDFTAHIYGPDSYKVGNALNDVDNAIAYLLTGLRNMNLHNCVNLIMVSDHGMEYADPHKVIYLNDYIGTTISSISVRSGGAPRISPSNKQIRNTFDYESIVHSLKCVSRNQTFIPLYKEEFPKRFHYANSDRIESLLVYMKSGWQLTSKLGKLNHLEGGFHGSDNAFSSMRAVFIGHGPVFKKGIEFEIFDNIEIYNLMCDILGIEPTSNNGTRGVLNGMLKNATYNTNNTFPKDNSIAEYIIDTDKNYIYNFTENNNDNNEIYKYFTGYHMPFGPPSVIQKNNSYYISINSGYVSAYSYAYGFPLWVSYTLTNNYSFTIDYGCNIANNCKFYDGIDDVKIGFLYPILDINNISRNLSYTTNTVPMYTMLKKVLGVFAQHILTEYVEKYHIVNVISGPVFDNDHDGIYDTNVIYDEQPILIPTHYFIIITFCDFMESLHECNKISVNSYIMPNSDVYYDTCGDDISVSFVKELFALNTARIIDIETATGLRLFRYLDYKNNFEQIMLLKTYIKE